MEEENVWGRILIYTRKPQDDYTESLSNSIHFAYSYGTEEFNFLNNNYGILFAPATVDSDNVIHEKGLKNPYIFRTVEGEYAIIAVRILENGKEDEASRGHLLLWTSSDLIIFHYKGLIKLHDSHYVKQAACEYDRQKEKYLIHWQSEDNKSFVNEWENIKRIETVSDSVFESGFLFLHPEVLIEGIVTGNEISVDETTMSAFRNCWTPVYHKKTNIPQSVTASASEQVEAVKATLVYSNDSTVEKNVKWDYSTIDFSKTGVYTIKGEIISENYQFPLASGYADPVIFPWKSKYYFIATNDNKNDIGIFIREADTVNALFTPGYKEHSILDLDEEKGFCQTFWAPEFHVIREEVYIFFAVSGNEWGPQCHIMKLKKGGSILKPEDWSVPERVRKSDGSFLSTKGITLDMTYFKSGDTSCVVWSYRENIGTSLDTGSMLYIATISEADPMVLTSEPVLLSRPLYGWENGQGTINNEGPYPLVTKDSVYITYSGGAACGYTYALGLLSIPHGGDFLDRNAWKKANTPVLSYYSIKNVYGPGHNSFFADYDGTVWIMYHGEENLVPFGTRCTAMHKVYFSNERIPCFDLVKDRELNPKLSRVTMEVIVK